MSIWRLLRNEKTTKGRKAESCTVVPAKPTKGSRFDSNMWENGMEDNVDRHLCHSLPQMRTLSVSLSLSLLLRLSVLSECVLITVSAAVAVGPSASRLSHRVLCL